MKGEIKMEQKNSIDEILELAIFRELYAYHFYKALAKLAASNEMKKTLDEFALEELNHKEKLELELFKIGQSVQIDEKTPEPTEDYIISNIQPELDMEYKDILLLAIEKEEASFKIYVNLANSICDDEARDVILGIAEEEVRHKIYFENKYDNLFSKR